MNKNGHFTKVLLAILVLALAFAAVPFTTASAAPLSDEPTPPDYSRLEALWARQLAAYARAENNLARSDEMISRIQGLIEKANEKGWDATAIQAALDAFHSAVQDARPKIQSANGIVNSHKGFDDSGKVTDRAQALETVQELGAHLKEARAAMNGTGKALHEALRAFREAHRPATAP